MRITVPIGALLPACTLVLAGALPCRPQTVAHPPHAQRAPRVMEEILDFHSDVTLHDDATLEVTETVTVVSAGSQIRHGIYREFPTRYTDSLNNEYVVGFQMLSATCDSADTPFRVEDYANGKRIYLGDPRYFVQPGRHLYTLTYTTNRQLGRGVIMALYQPPQDLLPAATRYLMRMGFDNKTFAAAILDMAVRGFLTIKEQAGSYTLYLTGKDNRVLTPDEKAVAELLFAGRSQIWLHNENHQTLQDSMHTLKDWLASAEQKTYFVTNSRYLLPSVILSIAIVLVYLLSMGGPQVFAGAFLGVWLTVWTLGVAAMLRTVYTLWRNIFYPHTSAITGAADTGKAVLLSAFALPFLFGELMGFFFLLKMTSLAFVVFVLACGVLHILFLYLMKAPTFAGRRLMDQVEGFKMFLGEVHGDRLNRAAPPEQTPAVFEKFLPYALALDVEQAWANKFSGVLKAASAAPGASSPGYTPSFYSGHPKGKTSHSAPREV